ncbi:MAG TPA: ATP-binding protein [Polyangiaceae bacterium]|nr:ATP-binding protein [Polyangiaceae bacterium]
MELVILVGLQAAGKSTFRRSRFDGTHVVVSKDELRNNRRPARRQEQLIRTALAAGRSVIVDNTNSRQEDRAQLVALAREYSAKAVAYFLPLSVPESIRRNARREGRERVPDIGVYATARVFTAPTWEEGFDELYEVLVEDDHSIVIRSMSREPGASTGTAVPPLDAKIS